MKEVMPFDKHIISMKPKLQKKKYIKIPLEINYLYSNTL